MKPCYMLLLAFASLIFTPVHAQAEQPPVPAAPANGGYILDELDWLTPVQESSIESMIRGLDKDGVAEIAVITLNDCGSDKSAFRKQLFDTWGIGHADDNDGLLILVCWYNGDRSRRSVEQLYGPGLNRVLSSSRTDQIAQQDFVPAFQAGNPGDGLVAMVRDYNVELRTSKSALDSITNLDAGLQGILFFFAAFIVVLIIRKIFLGALRSGANKDRDNYDGSSGGGDSGFGGGSSDGGSAISF
jgi:uncharacterized protein